MTVTIDLTSPNHLAVVTGVGACVVDALGQTPAGAPTRQCLLVPSSVIPHDDCDCGGQVAQAIRRAYGSQVFPGEAAPKDWVMGCGPAYWVVEVVVSVTRCVPTIDQAGQPPSCADELAAAITLEHDRIAVRQAIACCLEQLRSAAPPTHGVGAWALGSSVTLPESGACAGSETTYLVGLRACPCPPSG